MIPKEELPGEIHRLYDIGYSKEDIATALGIAYSTVMRILKEGGKSEYRKKVPPADTAEQAILKAFKEGYAFTEIPGHTGISNTTVAKVLKKHNLLRAAVMYAGKKFNTEAEMKAYRTILRKQIDNFVLMGLTNEQIALKLNVSEKIVKELKA